VSARSLGVGEDTCATGADLWRRCPQVR